MKEVETSIKFRQIQESDLSKASHQHPDPTSAYCNHARHDYLVNPKDVDGPFMILSYDSTTLAQKHLKAGMHPYDKTIRPQVLRQEQNPKYYQIIKKFEELTGMGGILNTSFNLHGDPVVCSPTDALYTFENSGLKYLALENYLISKS